jgi:hypothetical protein
MFGREVVEGEQLIDVAGDLGDRLGKLRAVGCLEGLHLIEGVGLILGVPDLRKRFLGPRMR